MEVSWMLWYIQWVRWLLDMPATIDPPSLPVPSPATTPPHGSGSFAPTTSLPEIVEIVESWSLSWELVVQCICLAAFVVLLIYLRIEISKLVSKNKLVERRAVEYASKINALELQMTEKSAWFSGELEDRLQQISALETLAEGQKQTISEMLQQQQQDLKETSNPTKTFAGKEFPNPPKRFSTCNDVACDKDYKKIYSDYTVLRSKLQVLEHFSESLKNEIGFVEGYPATGPHHCEDEGESLRELIHGLSARDCNDKRRRFIEWCCTYDKFITSLFQAQLKPCNKRCNKCKKGFIVNDNNGELFCTYENPASTSHGQEMCRWCISDTTEADKKKAEEVAKKTKKANQD